MPWWAILCAAFFGLVTGLTGIVCLVLTLRFFARLGGLFQRLEPGLLALEMESQMLALRGEELALTQERFAESRARLDVSLARLRVLDWALEDVRAAFGFVRLVRPTK